jgi:hypothetical protein
VNTPPDRAATGAEMIAAERQRQIEAEGWTPEHDDEHDDVEMVQAAACNLRGVIYGWPWVERWW